MKVAVIGSRSLFIENLTPYLPPDTTELISGGARGIDACVRAHAQRQNIPLTEILPNYAYYGRYAAPIIRNQEIADRADRVIAFWDGVSHGTEFIIEYCQESNIPITVIRMEVE